ncbi:hypothetical protein [Caenimonas aquaedulcis]|uniref:Sulfotransferase family protein n=1 Tax=Caenimonas aquaedulcis TaxID=2793270 RepID=A0A931H419_9BURK|nr:hypothetical protein [Caenimonas aquaedulcis]MBG9388184.1 hypothetical protein [Caenimonas aquaedulcis]
MRDPLHIFQPIRSGTLLMAESTSSRRALDFIVVGVARSGTTALARSINLDAHLYCAIEYFSGQWDVDYGNLSVPEAFFDDAYHASGPKNTELSRLTLREKLAQGEVAAFGNKLPTYHLILDRVNAQLPALRNLCIYRSLNFVTDSVDRRAANPNDDWPEGRTGLFSLFDWVILLARIAEARFDMKVLDYDAMFFADPAIAGQVLHYVGGRVPSSAALDLFRRNEFAGGGRIISKSPKATRYDAFLRRIGAPELDREISRAMFVPAADLHPTLRAFVQENLAVTIAHVADSVVAGGLSSEMSWARRWAFMTLAAFDKLDSWTFSLLAPALIDFQERLFGSHLADGMDDVLRFCSVWQRRGLDAAAAQRIRRLVPGHEAQPSLRVSKGDPAKPSRGSKMEGPSSPSQADQDAANAVTEARKAVDAAPNDRRARLVLAQALYRSGANGEALRLLTQLIASGAQGGGVFLTYSRALHREGRAAEALQAAQHAVRASPDSIPAAKWLAQLQNVHKG